jgi:hypothetical protein
MKEVNISVKERVEAYHPSNFLLKIQENVDKTAPPL